jgi:hypothetical protein
LGIESKVIREEVKNFMNQQVRIRENTCISQVLTAFSTVGVFIKTLPPGVFAVDTADVVKAAIY